MYHHHSQAGFRVSSRALSLIAGGALLWLPLSASAETSPTHAEHTSSQQTAMTPPAAWLGGETQRSDDH